ncbi:MAG: hypothetical protein M3010_05855 [Candidatus Dormibacteraeota bacterium]|nr:hypothetical protein [Candidatus Dormibacteraeota bacterium]
MLIAGESPLRLRHQARSCGWRELLDELDSVTRREVVRFRGRLVKSRGGGPSQTRDLADE